MSSEINEKLSIKALLFTRPIPVYALPVPIDDGQKIYPCIDCGDKFLFKSSYDYHVNRKSVKITYKCRFCKHTIVFTNRCNLLCHIRSHSFKTVTININDLKVEPYLPVPAIAINKKKDKQWTCDECHITLAYSDIQKFYKDRAAHFMRNTTEMHTCPICLFIVPTKCAINAHMRLHLKVSPLICPECGVLLKKKMLQYPFNHDCPGFNTMRVTTRVKCPMNCCVLHPSYILKHLDEHKRKLFKCPHCIVTCSDEKSIRKHLTKHTGKPNNHLTVYQCDICEERVIPNNMYEKHAMTHSECYVYPCWTCNVNFDSLSDLIGHQKEKACNSNAITAEKTDDSAEPIMYRVVKRCDSCLTCFVYRCKHSEIISLPILCPNKCSPIYNVVEVSRNDQQNEDETANHIKCNLCEEKVPHDWKEIKKHFAEMHKENRCLDIEVALERLSTEAIERIKINYVPNLQRKRVSLTISASSDKNAKKQRSENSNTKETVVDVFAHVCIKCNAKFVNKHEFHEHIISHRDPCAAYQCMECSGCFIGKPSFAAHLLLKHNVSNIEEYMKNNQCYNKDALEKQLKTNVPDDVPLKDNQCNICRDEFENREDLEKHYRVHGMAFLMKNNKPSP